MRVVPLGDLHEQDVNAQTMQPREFERLAENIRQRGALESMPYCAQPGGRGPIAIVSGHHRVRAARVAGLERIPVLVDVLVMTRSELVARQIAHNTLVGRQDENTLRQLLGEVTEADDLLATGLDETMLTATAADTTPLTTPQTAIEWRLCSIAFLPAQMERFEDLVTAIEGRQALVGAAPLDSYEPFAQALGRFARFANIRSLGTAVAVLTETALKALEETPEEPEP